MKYAIIAPPEQLKDIVRCFWIFESSTSEIFPDEHQVMADGCPELVLQYDGGFPEYSMYEAYFRFQHSEPKLIVAPKKFGLMGVRFFPHAIQLLFGIPADILANKVHELRSIAGIAANDLVSKILDMKDDSDRISILCDFILSLAEGKEVDRMYKIVQSVLGSDGELSIDEMLSLTRLSVKQFERRFKEIAGFSPKYYSRIIRFKSTKRKFITGNYRTLSELAYDCNYYDQPHFNREFKEFSGMQASQYFKLITHAETPESQILKGLLIAKDAVRQRA